jgi:hypothetical protein
MAITRYMFINNYSSTIISIQITAYENVGVFEMRTEGSVEQQVETQSIGGGSSVTWTMRVPAGGIYGLGVYNGLSYTNPDPSYLTIVTGDDKDPWPTPPPPPPPLFQSVSDFGDRYGDFLIALTGKRERPERAA